MTLVKWNPFRELEDMSERLNRLTARTDWPVGEESLVNAEWSPLVDIQETDKEYLIKAELPEIKKDDVKVFIKDGLLTIEGERKQELEEKDRKFHRIERSYGKFMRCFNMPENTDEKSVKAEFANGLLAVHLTKSAAAKPRSIEVRVV
jgi:HSP20 family protein